MRDIMIVQFEVCSYGLVAFCLYSAAHRVAYLSPRFSRGMGWAAITTLLVVGGFGYAELRPGRTIEVLGVAIVAWIASSLAALAFIVVLPPFASMNDGWKRTVEQRKQQAEIRGREERAERMAQEHQAKEEQRHREKTEKAEQDRLKAESDAAFERARAARLAQQAQAATEEAERNRPTTEQLLAAKEAELAEALATIDAMTCSPSDKETLRVKRRRKFERETRGLFGEEE